MPALIRKFTCYMLEWEGRWSPGVTTYMFNQDDIPYKGGKPIPRNVLQVTSSYVGKLISSWETMSVGHRGGG